MPILYLDNFRGFSSKYLHLKHINFFVGENSTGKTSILKLLGILSSPSFWRHNVFGEDSEGTSLGTFSEIVSALTSRSYFEIGLIDFKKNEAEKVCAYKFRFIEGEKFPSIKEFKYIEDGLELQATIEGEILKYRYILSEHISIESDQDEEIFKRWIESNNLIDKAFKRVVSDSKSLTQIIFQLQALINFEQRIHTPNSEPSNSRRIGFPSILNMMAWFAPTVASPNKTYTQQQLVFVPTGSHIPSVLQDIMPNPDVKKILSRFGQDSGLYDSIEVKNLSPNQAVSARLSEIEQNAFEIQFSLSKTSHQMLNIVNVGYGVSQVLPLIVEAIARPDNTWIVAQQPETHLHPKAQAALGEFIHKTHVQDNQKFVFETHSDYIIDRFRLRLNAAYKNSDAKGIGISQVVFFSRSEHGNDFNIVKIAPDGSYDDNQPENFRDFFLKEQLNLLRF
ncbi:AAA family ATPase [Pedobacter aquatilis]|uniref:AAA family ATPase n=1 Tax=Pedobacter aquatilis TaxID=351343 RepID=UPI00292DD1AA|nr:AAA family ATPase [Pedobacter aquatilis]